MRGLGPNFRAITFDGMPLACNENIRNSGRSGRQFRLQVLPATLIASIVVIKSLTADLVGTGVGSTGDIRLINPQDRDSVIVANAALPPVQIPGGPGMRGRDETARIS